MPRTTMSLKPCTVTMGKPFETSGRRMCPIYERMKKTLESWGWTQKKFHSSKVPQGDICYFKFEGQEEIGSGAETKTIIHVLDVNIEGLNKASGNKCTVILSLESFYPEDRLTIVRHESETQLLDSLVKEARMSH